MEKIWLLVGTDHWRYRGVVKAFRNKEVADGFADKLNRAPTTDEKIATLRTLLRNELSAQVLAPSTFTVEPSVLS